MRSSLKAISGVSQLKNTHDMTSKAVGDEKAGHASPHMIAPWWVNRGRAAAHSQVVVGSFSKMWRSSCARRYYSTHMRMLYAKLGSNWQMVIYVKLARLRNLILKVSYQLRFLNFRDKVYFAYRDLSPHRPFQELTQIYTKQLTTSTKETFTFSNIISQFGFKNMKSSAQVSAPPPK